MMHKKKLQTLSLAILIALPFHVSSKDMAGVFSWSGKVPLTPPMVITETTQPISSNASPTFNINSINTSVTYTLTSFGKTSAIRLKIIENGVIVESTNQEQYIKLIQSHFNYDRKDKVLAIFTVSSIV